MQGEALPRHLSPLCFTARQSTALCEALCARQLGPSRCSPQRPVFPFTHLLLLIGCWARWAKILKLFFLR